MFAHNGRLCIAGLLGSQSEGVNAESVGRGGMEKGSMDSNVHMAGESIINRV